MQFHCAMNISDVMTRYPLTLPKSADFALARQMMVWAGIRHIPITDGDELVGVLSDRDMLEVLAKDPAIGSNPKVGVALRADFQTASPDDSLTEVAARMAADKLDGLPVTKRGALVGLVTTIDILNAEVRKAMEPRDSDVKAGTLGSRSPVTAAPEDRLLDAAGRMQSKGVRHLPVVDGTLKVVGILSDRDIRAAIGDPMSAYEPGARDRFDALRVRDYMSQDPITVHESDSLAFVSRLFVDHRLSAAPLVDADDKLVGVISYLDILRVS